MTTRTDFGVLYGQKTTASEDTLLIYSSYEDSKASPKIGDFIVLTPKDEGGRKFLARVEAEIYDEDPMFRNQDKTLVAVHYARIAERELSERDKQKMFSYTYQGKNPRNLHGQRHIFIFYNRCQKVADGFICCASPFARTRDQLQSAGGQTQNVKVQIETGGTSPRAATFQIASRDRRNPQLNLIGSKSDQDADST